MTRLWDKGQSLDSAVLGFTAGEDHALDNRLVRHDIRASIAHAEMLAAQGLLSAPELDAIRAALAAIGEEHAHGRWTVSLEQEDCQTAIENLLTARIGAAGGRLHAGRSRNDQVLAALRLYLGDAARDLEQGALGVADALDALAARHPDLVIPGYTHMQQAMPSSVALWAGGFAAEIRDDAQGLAAAQRRIGKNPLGSAAGYGTPGLPISREETRRRLGFAVTQEPVTAVQLSRGKAEAQLLFEVTLLAQDLSRLAADLLLFYTQEFGLVALPDGFTTGSSIMPQKRNPDVFELVRGRSSVAQAALNEVLGVTQKLTSGYHRDLQLIKAPLFRAVDSCLQTLAILPRALDGVVFRAERVRLDPGIHAAARANEMVARENIPFREAYRRVAAKLEDEPK
ncbi:MAG TPA: argininosuccinate lyase [Steroidobacteraceae bacterium]|jgi:argininosuccinate lyase|nr:argininosuccinate lyase [Steroidobacteraceae bacterium]